MRWIECSFRVFIPALQFHSVPFFISSKIFNHFYICVFYWLLIRYKGIAKHIISNRNTLILLHLIPYFINEISLNKSFPFLYSFFLIPEIVQRNLNNFLSIYNHIRDKSISILVLVLIVILILILIYLI